MSWTNYHSHSYYCDGKYAPEKHVEEAVNQGLIAYGVSTHSPVPFDSTWNMKMDKVQEYVKEVRDAQEKFKAQIQVYLGMEVDYIPDVVGCSSDFIKAANLDYSVGSVHYVDQFNNGTPWEIDGAHKLFLDGLAEIFDNDAQKAVERFFELNRMMVENDCPDVVGHLDKIKMQNEGGELFSEESNWYKTALLTTLETIASAKTIVEVNTRGLYKKATTEPYPSIWALKHIKDMNIPICINSDSHVPNEITKEFETTAELLSSLGFKELHILYNNEWQPLPFDKNGVIL